MPVIAIVLIVVALIIVGWFIGTSNKLNKAVVKIEEADSDIDVALTKRYDTLTKMVDVVKGYAKHEKETIFEVINLRKGMSVKEKQEASQKMDAMQGQINVLAEAYPELKSSENYNTLQKSIVEVEEHLQASRRMFNANVSVLNQMIVTFPTSIVAGMKGLGKKEFFEADDVKKEDVKMDL
jgi:LemA protein